MAVPGDILRRPAFAIPVTGKCNPDGEVLRDVSNGPCLARPPRSHAALPAHAAIAALNPYAPVGKQHNILIVEDDEALRRSWRSALRMGGFEVLQARDGIEALDLIDGHPPDLVVVDLGAPGLGAGTVRTGLAARAATRRIPLVVITGSTDVVAGTINGACVLEKPVSADELVAMVQRCLRAGVTDLTF
jgi:CheY-like chemotaxis protein